MGEIFRAEDFSKHRFATGVAQEMADKANARIAPLIDALESWCDAEHGDVAADNCVYDAYHALKERRG